MSGITEPTLSLTRAARFDLWLEACSDRLNPMLVREVRQALRSRVFGVTFQATLLGALAASLIAFAGNADVLEYQEVGASFLHHYSMVLMACLCFVVPAALFGSLRSELGDTHDVLIVSTLTPAMIVIGKLQAGLVHMGLYYSAVAPFICLTYLLGGVSVPGILMYLLISFCTSLAICFFAVLLGSLSAHPAWSVVNMVLLVGAGAFAYSMVAGAVTSDGIDRAARSWEGLACVLIGFGVLLFNGGLISLGIASAQFYPALPQTEVHGPGQALSVKRLPPVSARPRADIGSNESTHEPQGFTRTRSDQPVFPPERGRT